MCYSLVTWRDGLLHLHRGLSRFFHLPIGSTSLWFFAESFSVGMIWALVLEFTQVHDIWWKTLIYISIAAIRLIFANCLGMHLPFDFDLPLPLGPNVRVLFFAAMLHLSFDFGPSLPLGRTCQFFFRGGASIFTFLSWFSARVRSLLGVLAPVW